MKQLTQSLRTGQLEIIDCPIPSCNSGNVVIQTTHSVISTGTEKMLLEFSKASYLEKAKSQPEKVKQVLDKIKTDGLFTTFESVKSKLDHPLPLGYTNVGVVKEVGSWVSKFQVGDRVISNGYHAEFVSAPKNLCAIIPDNVTDEEAAFTVPAAIALQGIRLAKPTLGETFVVTGLGLIGLLTVQLLKAQGCRVLGIDYDSIRCDLASRFGAEVVNLSKGENAVSTADHFTREHGVDGVLITAATKSNEPVQQAAKMCRKRGRIILVGVTGLELNRDDFYEKELTFQVSCSYGPGRYDQNYEQKGYDYPLGFVRWTEQRNFEAVLDMMAEGKLVVKPLITHRFPFHEAEAAYDVLLNDKTAIGILFEYNQEDDKKEEEGRKTTVEIASSETVSSVPGSPVVGCIGAGNFAKLVLLPSLKQTPARLKMVADLDPVTSTHAAKKYGFEYSCVDYREILEDPDINTVFITTRHDSHARLVVESLEVGKNIYVEKPLALTLDELDKIQSSIVNNQSSIIMVGFNRRFAPHIVKMKVLLDARKQPKSFIFTINAGAIPADHWAQDSEVGGGRIVGEACHFIDLMRFLSDSPIKDWSAHCMGRDALKDKVTINLRFKDGSFGSIHYLANGSKRFPKERIEVFCGGSIIQLDNFRKMKGYGWSGFKRMTLRRQDKGHEAEVNAFIEAVKNGEPSPIPFAELIEVSRTTIEIASTL